MVKSAQAINLIVATFFVLALSSAHATIFECWTNTGRRSTARTTVDRKTFRPRFTIRSLSLLDRVVMGMVTRSKPRTTASGCVPSKKRSLAFQPHNNCPINVGMQMSDVTYQSQWV
jgi:hypothetical protein